MRNLIVALVTALFLLSAFVAHAGTFDLRWDPVTGATSYDIEQSVDGLSGWTVAKAAIPPSACVAGVCSTSLTMTFTGVMHFRAAALNAVGRTIKYDGGAWKCETCSPPAAPSGLGAK